jgi:hypothetical protein
LHTVGGGVAIAQHAETEVVQPVGVTVVDACEGPAITGRGGTSELCIAGDVPVG